nr:developmentally-regulated gtp-binding protein 2 [Quercus suber]
MRRTQSNDILLLIKLLPYTDCLERIRPRNIIWAFLKGGWSCLGRCAFEFETEFYRKLARLRAQLLEPGPGAGSAGGTGFDVSKSGDARIALVGFPSVGKSTFLSKVTKTKSEVAAYSFTTLTAIPGVLEYGGAEIQVLDLPGIIEGAAEGKGRGRQVISAAKVQRLDKLL